jgi:hypothetical protein
VFYPPSSSLEGDNDRALFPETKAGRANLFGSVPRAEIEGPIKVFRSGIEGTRIGAREMDRPAHTIRKQTYKKLVNCNK